MVTSSSSSSGKDQHVFPSFHGPDVRRGFLSHLHSIFARKEIPMFKDQEIERGHTIGSELVQGIREASASIVVLSKNYASSVWCLDELLEILKCKEASGQIVMPIFYDVDPSDVRKQKGDFGIAFERTCESETEEKKQRWIEALACVATIAGEHTRNWTDESAMVEKISTDVNKKLVKKEFMAQDLDKDGFITAPELRYHLTKDGNKEITDERVSALISLVDVDGDGRISFDEYLKFSMIKDDALEKLVTDASNKLKVKELKKEFKAIDIDQNGFITAPELRYYLTSNMDKEITDEVVSAMILAADVDGDGRISFDEFVKFEMIKEDALEKLVTDASNKTEVEEQKKEFKAMDLDHNGFITTPELQYYLTKVWDTVVTDDEVSAIIQVSDVDGDGRISFDEFNQLMKNLRMIADEDAAMDKKFVTDVTLSRNEKQIMMAVFMTFDVDDDGFISAADFKYAMKNRGEEVSDKRAREFIRVHDTDGDGLVSYDDFIKHDAVTREKATVQKIATNTVKKFIKFFT